MTTSMTGFASRTGAALGYRWAWELRSVNGRGLDLRLRVPDWISGLEQGLRARIGKSAARGSINLTLRISREEEKASLALDPAALDAVLDALDAAEARAMDRGMTLAPTTAGALLSLRGVLDASSADDDDTGPLKAALMADAEPLIDAFVQMRRQEGASLAQVLTGVLDEIDDLARQAREIATTRTADMDSAFRAALDRVRQMGDVDTDRVAQEIAMIAVKADIAEELDRLDTHITAARALLKGDGPIGRKLDFLSQEFNREANTLCSKAQHSAMTAVGLELKVVIDRLREQVQNVE